jgi:hypothetical protein
MHRELCFLENNNGLRAGCTLGPTVALTTQQPNDKVLAAAGKQLTSPPLQLWDMEAGVSARVAFHRLPS